MKVAIMQPYLFPYIGYWQLINAVDTFVIYDDVNFIKQGFINRNYFISRNNNQPQRFTLELKGASSNKLINEIEIGDNNEKILKTIFFNYKKTLFFDEFFPIIEDILRYNEKKLSKYIFYSIRKICEFLDINASFIFSSEIDKDINLRGQDKIIDICKIVGSHVYINSIGGKELYDKKIFKDNGIDLFFLRPEIISYKQFNNKFVPYLSIIDIMMFNNKEQIKRMLNMYELL